VLLQKPLKMLLCGARFVRCGAGAAVDVEV